ncbi:nitroreductase family deazaflavin-dependent oxidoreductase [Mycobacterium vicinigordonae]|uniref:Nitroreductase family deazaflavin-dependent oxidoreductase n=1 Tax=Mycobacterium vicinigordonae TaxID=1719132 RepID=A0A7D6IRM7_9MYCO|nr:nitroreductase family deazaflavin-dependent oxidoreductase [Mycobacterium vicinigordonae]
MRFSEAVGERIAMSWLGYQLAVHVVPSVDKFLLPRTNGRLSAGGMDLTGLLKTTGAKSGQPRVHPLVLIQVADGLLAIGSNYGRSEHPGWSANLLKHPECTVQFKGQPRQYRAELLTGDERAKAWAAAVDYYPGYDNYRARCAPREIRVFRLRPV